MNDFLLVLGIAAVTAFLTYLGAPLAEALEVPHRVVSAALQFAAGILAAIVAFTLMPPAVLGGPPFLTVLAFFIGGGLYVWIEYVSAQSQAAKAETGNKQNPLGFYIGVLLDFFVDGVLIGLGSTQSLTTGLVLAVGIAISTLPLAFVTITTAKRQGMARERRRQLAFLFIACIVAGAILGYGILRNQPEPLRLVLIALASGFLITTITQGMIPEANREGEPSFAGIFFVGGLSLYALLTLSVK
jgi:ZIP family zinc transporter